jgi:hypothetical protein
VTYSVKYKTKNRWFWASLKKVKGDLVSPDMPGVRIFILEDETRVEIPLEGTEFSFCNRRFLSIKAQVEKEAGQKLPIG